MSHWHVVWERVRSWLPCWRGYLRQWGRKVGDSSCDLESIRFNVGVSEVGGAESHWDQDLAEVRRGALPTGLCTAAQRWNKAKLRAQCARLSDVVRTLRTFHG